MKIILTGGGSGGHITPLIAIIEALRTQYALSHPDNDVDKKSSLKLFFIGSVTVNELNLIQSQNLPVYRIPSGKLRRYFSFRTIVDLIFLLPIGFFLALWHVALLNPDIVISKGGFGSIPTSLAAAIYGVPIILHESDVSPGLANRFIAFLASAICISWIETAGKLARHAKKITLTGIPVRSSFISLNQSSAKKALGLPTNEKLVFIMGGSQGAQEINEIIIKILPQLIYKSAVLHVTGPKNYDRVVSSTTKILRASTRRHLYKVEPFLTESIARAISAADVVVMRAGATSIAEIAHLHKPALLIPLINSAGDHQQENAAMLEKYGAAYVIGPANRGPGMVEQAINQLLKPNVAPSIIKQISALDKPSAATDIAKIALKLANQ
jgi:UDP-N-acetylglucosamine--N-acetylmuramyl-(pentapeptide) pyrophosphoryl-undecaprenol N-acetylglucosamine transferase